MILKWGKPLLEIIKLVDGEIPSSSPQWTALDNPVEDSTQLETTEGDVIEATGEGGELVDAYIKASTYQLTFQLFAKRGAEKPIEDEDGVILDEYAIRLTPEDDTLPGFMLPKCRVSVVDTYNAADGERWQYTFRALKPTTGTMKQEYTKSA